MSTAPFKLFMANLPQPDDLVVSTIRFADDLVVLAFGSLATASVATNRYFGKLAAYYTQNGKKCNTNKSNELIVTGVLH